jgi:hypothetical protein
MERRRWWRMDCVVVWQIERLLCIHAWRHLWKYASPNTWWRHLLIYMHEDIHMLHKWSARDVKPHKC